MKYNSKVIYGYNIGNEILYQVSGRALLNIKRVSGMSSKVHLIKLRKTMAELFLYLLKNATKRVVYDDEILTQIWDKHGLKGSHHRLWQVMKDLKIKVIEIGLTEDFIIRVNGKGYLLKHEVILPLCVSE